MKYRKGIAREKNHFMQALMVAIIIYEIGSPAIARPDQLRDLTTNTAMISNETKRIEQLRLVESARIAFKEATLAGGERTTPYEFYLAQEYLTLAEEEFRSGDMGVSRFAAASHKYSSIACKKAEEELQ